jgi:hypothetical protein
MKNAFVMLLGLNYCQMTSLKLVRLYLRTDKIVTQDIYFEDTAICWELIHLFISKINISFTHSLLHFISSHLTH